MDSKIITFPSRKKLDLIDLERSILRDAEEESYIHYYNLAEMYETGHVFKENPNKAIELYKKFYEEHRKRRVKIDLIEVLMKIGHLHMKEGNKYRAAEIYIEASLQIIGDYSGKEREKALKKYKIEKYLKKTGYQNLLV